MNWILLICTVIALLVSLIRSREKTLTAIKVAAKRMWNITPLFLLVMALFAAMITIIPESFISKSRPARQAARDYYQKQPAEYLEAPAKQLCQDRLDAAARLRQTRLKTPQKNCISC